tara:strand:+ start:258 stop:563 length:306 start_codon:yes stop_codon:yes gene_type:complete
MTEDEIQRLADLIFDRMMEKQERLDQDYYDQVKKLHENGYVISETSDSSGLNDEERLVGELARLQTMMMILEDKEEYEKAAVIQKKIQVINKKLNDGTGKY